MLPPRKQPGGWSSHGQPVDQLHSSYRKRIRDLDIQAAGMKDDFRSRDEFSSLNLRANGQIQREVANWLQVIEISYKAWTSLERRIFQSSWVVCGYVDPESMVASEHPAQMPSLNEAQQELAELFKPYGLANTPQRCTTFEWQIEAQPCPC